MSSLVLQSLRWLLLEREGERVEWLDGKRHERRHRPIVDGQPVGGRHIPII
jgi:hypothetical protein